jgi:hypothetical protein
VAGEIQSAIIGLSPSMETDVLEPQFFGFFRGFRHGAGFAS